MQFYTHYSTRYSRVMYNIIQSKNIWESETSILYIKPILAESLGLDSLAVDNFGYRQKHDGVQTNQNNLKHNLKLKIFRFF